MLLPILLFPVLMPVLVAGVNMTGGLLDGETLGDARQSACSLVLFYDVLFCVVAYLTFELRRGGVSEEIRMARSDTQHCAILTVICGR